MDTFGVYQYKHSLSEDVEWKTVTLSSGDASTIMPVVNLL